ncbi:thioredoxin family protein [Pseudoxanthomonas suwonensis]|uniref:thioredoxin family protein n=1 Tax=Pseudoxanthomonas suwonensis TaxID=314722 RepID=UPI00138ED416|nr:thioredoxin family protein [Pseudoxanthomonas suwonensis]KAF1704441.1 hypothetical protein CSC68_03085 [Pseudoxanthomonas suwonensis]
MAGARDAVMASMLLALAGCGSDSQHPAGPPRPVDTTPQEAHAPDATEPVASGNTRAAADVAALAGLRAAFDPSRSAVDDLESAQVEARRGSRHIVLEFGQPGCEPCEALAAGIEGDAALRSRRNAGFVWVRVDRSAPGNAAFVEGYPQAADAPAPHLVVLDADAQVLHAGPGDALLRRDGRADAKRIREFLETWAPPAP